MLGTATALAMSGLVGAANLIKSAKNLISSKRPGNTYASVNEGLGKHRKGHHHSGRRKAKRNVNFHPRGSGLPYNEKFGYLLGRLNGRATERYFEAVENLHGLDRANNERRRAGYEVA